MSEKKQSWNGLLAAGIIMCSVAAGTLIAWYNSYKAEKETAKNEAAASQAEAVQSQPEVKCMRKGLEVRVVQKADEVGLVYYDGMEVFGTTCCFDIRVKEDETSDNIYFECDNNVIMRSNNGKIEYIVGEE